MQRCTDLLANVWSPQSEEGDSVEETTPQEDSWLCEHCGKPITIKVQRRRGAVSVALENTSAPRKEARGNEVQGAQLYQGSAKCVPTEGTPQTVTGGVLNAVDMSADVLCRDDDVSRREMMQDLHARMLSLRSNLAVHNSNGKLK